MFLLISFRRFYINKINVNNNNNVAICCWLLHVWRAEGDIGNTHRPPHPAPTSTQPVPPARRGLGSAPVRAPRGRGPAGADAARIRRGMGYKCILQHTKLLLLRLRLFVLLLLYYKNTLAHSQVPTFHFFFFSGSPVTAIYH